jgi:hypothetical protein
MMTRRVAASVGAIGASTLLIACAVGSASASTGDGRRTLGFTNAIDSLAPLDLGAPGPSAGDQFLVASHIVAGGVTGTTAASCQVVTTAGAGVRLCEVDFTLSDGVLTTRGLTNTAQQSVRLVVTGGTGRYAGARGSGTLTPTATGSVVALHLSD